MDSLSSAGNRIAVTGGAGFLGGRLVAALVDGTSHVTAVCRRPVPWLAGAEMVVADLAHASDALDRALTGIDTVIHLAGDNEVAFRADPAGAGARTLVAARTVVDAAQRAGVGRLVYVSTIHVYGDAPGTGAVVAEAVEPHPTSPYAASRLAVEQAFREPASHDPTRPGQEVVIFRLSNSVGAPVHAGVDRWSLVANDLCRQAVLAGSLRLETSGTQSRDFVALSDVVSILSTSTRSGGIPPGVYNLACGQNLSVIDLALRIQRAAANLGLGSIPLRTDSAPGTTRAPGSYRIDVSRLAAAGARASTPLSSAIEELLRFCIEHREALPR